MSRSIAYHPQGNGHCECLSKTSLGLLRSLPPARKLTQPEYIKTLVFLFTLIPEESTSYSPYYLMYGRQQTLQYFFLGISTNASYKINIDRWLDLNSKKLLFTYNKAKDQPNRNEIVKKQENEIWRLEICLQIGFNVFIRTKFKTNGKLKFM